MDGFSGRQTPFLPGTWVQRPGARQALYSLDSREGVPSAGRLVQALIGGSTNVGESPDPGLLVAYIS